MIRNLIYAALGVGGVVALAAGVLSLQEPSAPVADDVARASAVGRNVPTLAAAAIPLAASSADAGTNIVVKQGQTNIAGVVVSKANPVRFDVIGVSTFYMETTNMSVAVDCRVSIDPAEGHSRTTNLVLSVEREKEPGTWISVCGNITEFSVTNVVCAFTNGNYRFSVPAAAKDDAFVIGLDLKWAKVDFDPLDDKAVPDGASLSFCWTVDMPYGYTPPLTNSARYGAFKGWYDSPSLTAANEITNATVVLSNAMAYAHWEKQPYLVEFIGGEGAVGTMADQAFATGAKQALSPNQYCKSGYRFNGWDTDSTATNVVYKNRQVVCDLCAAGETKNLYAVWDPTPGTNWYYVAGDATNFTNVEVSASNPAYFVGRGDAAQFFVTTRNVGKCRVSIDPDEGGRTNALLKISRAPISSGGSASSWSDVVSVTDLSTNEVTCSFTTNYQYKFEINAPPTAYSYRVGIGAEGSQCVFEPCNGAQSLAFNWTVDTPVGYLPVPATNQYVHGRYEWHYTPAMDETNLVRITDAVVPGGMAMYAHWTESTVVQVFFDYNKDSYPQMATNVVVSKYFAQGVRINPYKVVAQPKYEDWGFLGWTTNATAPLVWAPNTFTVSNSVTFYAQWSKDWRVSATSDGLTIDGYNGTPEASFAIPSEIGGRKVVAIGSSAFTNKTTIVTLDLPSALTSIGDSAFAGCTSMKSVSMKDALTSIGSSAFGGCSGLLELNIPAGVTMVGDGAFEDCTSLKKVSYPTVEVDDEYATEGFLDGVFDSSSPSVNLGECLFKGCTSLKDVELPLGVNCIPDECFSGCTAMTSFANMPYTVMEIGAEAFCGCTHLTNVVCKEIVNTIGEGAFRKCARLRFVSFIGDNPVVVESDILEGTPRNVLVRYLENMCETAADYCGGSWPALPALWPVAGDTDKSRTLTWFGKKYPRRKVIFNCNDKTALWECTQASVLYHEGRVFGLLAPTKDDMEQSGTGDFSGWYTQPMGGRKVGDYWVVPTASEGDSAPITVYAHWGDDEREGAETGARSYEVYYGKDKNTEGLEDFPGFYSAENEEAGVEGDDQFYYAASTFNGIVIDGTEIDGSTITGTVEFVFQDVTYPKEGGMQSAFTAAVIWNNGSKTTLSGVADAEGYVVAEGGKWSLGEEGDDHRTVITKSGLNGWLSNGDCEFRVYAARSRYAMSNDASKSVVLTGLRATKGTWHVVLEGSAASEEVEYNGYTTFSITIANMGQATITGTLGDGTKVSTTSTLIIGDGCCCLPVSVRPYGGKGGLAFMLWFTWKSDGSFGDEEAAVKGLTGWTSPTFTATLEQTQPLTFIDEKMYTGDAKFESGSVTAEVRMDGASWKVVGDNPDKVKLSYEAATGLFTGSFPVETEDGKKSTATVNGVFTDRINEDCSDTYHGYGTAVIKGVGSAKVEITTVP